MASPEMGVLLGAMASLASDSPHRDRAQRRRESANTTPLRSSNCGTSRIGRQPDTG